jgi:hypothetical protein
LLTVFGYALGPALILGLFMLAMYGVGSYYIESALWRRRERARIRSRSE